MSKVTMYRPVKTIHYRNKTGVTGSFMNDAFFTNRKKAVGMLRAALNDAEDAKEAYRRYERCDSFGFKDVRISLWTYEETDGRLICTKIDTFWEIREGVVTDETASPLFETK